MRACLLTHHVIYDTAVDIAFQQLVRLLNHEVTALQAFLVSIGGKQLYSILSDEILGQFFLRLELTQFLTVVVRIFEGELDNQPAHRRLLIV